MLIRDPACIGDGPTMSLSVAYDLLRKTPLHSPAEAELVAACARLRFKYWQHRRGRLSRLGCHDGLMNGGA